MRRLRQLATNLAIISAIVFVIAGVLRLYYGETYEELNYIGCDECMSELHERIDWFGPLQVSGSGPYRCSWIWMQTDVRIARTGLRVKLKDRPGCTINEMLDKSEAREVGGK